MMPFPRLFLYCMRKTCHCMSTILDRHLINGPKSTHFLCGQNLATACQPHVFPPRHRIPIRYTEKLQDVINSNSDKIEQFAAIMECDRTVIERIVRGDSRIVTSFNYEQVMEKFKILKEYKYSPLEISMHPLVFCLRFTELAERLATVELVRTCCSPLSLLSNSRRCFEDKVKEHQQDIDTLNGRNKLTFLADELECSDDDVRDFIDTGKVFLLTRRASAIHNLIDIIKENGFSLDQIRKHLHVLTSSVEEVRNRFTVVKESCVIDKISLGSILTSNRHKFQITIRNITTEMSYLEGYIDCPDILKRRLGISEDQLEVVYRRAPNLKQFSARKLQTTLDVLLTDMNIEPRDIMRNPIVLYYSVKRLKMRNAILEQTGISGSWNILINLLLNEETFAKRHQTHNI